MANKLTLEALAERLDRLESKEAIRDISIRLLHFARPGRLSLPRH